ncbi:DeoR family transcriptional regulator [Priestia koreensis]|uniref:DeoR family transcriptional regulator n=1 Tax=Priestia koreensis TaxID=284581 RepID=UPI0028F6D027|nr:DeoR family transcriptional regulator [Priestia koreensis]
MLPIDRQHQILEWLHQEETLRVSDISNRLNVSEMTVYRDLKPLIDSNQVIKTSNGIALRKEEPIFANRCSYCAKEGTGRLSIQIITHQQQIEHTCCAHCGLMRYEQMKEQVAQVIGRDFLLDTTVSAKMATFLIDSELAVQCCDPQVLVFASANDAKRFQAGFGGLICSFDEAIKIIHDKMNGTGCCSSKE